MRTAASTARGTSAVAGVGGSMGRGIAPERFAGLRSRVVLGRAVPVAETLRARTLGLSLLPLEQAPAGLLIPACRSVHTFGMLFPIDIVFLDVAGGEIRRVPLVGPRRLVSEPAAAAVLELRPGMVGPSAAPALEAQIRPSRAA